MSSVTLDLLGPSEAPPPAEENGTAGGPPPPDDQAPGTADSTDARDTRNEQDGHDRHDGQNRQNRQDRQDRQDRQGTDDPATAESGPRESRPQPTEAAAEATDPADSVDSVDSVSSVASVKSIAPADSVDLTAPADPDPDEADPDVSDDAPAPAARPPATARLRCATCGTLILADAPSGVPQADTTPVSASAPGHADDRAAASTAVTWRVPVHAGLPSPVDPFAATLCAGSGAPADPQADAVGDTADAATAPTPPPLFLPLGLHWRDQPFSHGPA